MNIIKKLLIVFWFSLVIIGISHGQGITKNGNIGLIGLTVNNSKKLGGAVSAIDNSIQNTTQNTTKNLFTISGTAIKAIPENKQTRIKNEKNHINIIHNFTFGKFNTGR